MRRSLLTMTLAALLALAGAAAPAAAAGGSPCEGRFGSFGTMALPGGSWGVGEHSYSATLYWPPDPADPEDTGSWTTDPVTFTVDPAAPLHAGPVFLRLFGLSSTVGAFTPFGDVINPAQETVFYAGIFLVPGDYETVKEARAFLTGVSFEFAWDGGGAVAANQTPVINVCGSGVVEMPDVVHMGGALHRHYAG